MVHFNFLLQIFLTIFLLRSAVQVYLHRLNISYLRQHGTIVPEIFLDKIDPEKLKRISAYTADSENFHMVTTRQARSFSGHFTSGFLPWLVKTIDRYPMTCRRLIFLSLSLLINLLRILQPL
jgi:hypothetical protein